MIQIFFIQLFFALVPSICGLLLLAYVSPKMYRLAKQGLQLDVQSVLFGVLILVGLLAINYGLVNEAVLAIARASFLRLGTELWNGTDPDATARLYAIYFLSLLVTPAAMLGRVILDMLFEKPLELGD
jgi:hypothetical protein